MVRQVRLVAEAAQVVGEGVGTRGQRTGVNDENPGGGRVKGRDDRGKAEASSDGDRRGARPGDGDGGHESSRCLKMVAATSDAGPGPLGTTSVATAR